MKVTFLIVMLAPQTAALSHKLELDGLLHPGSSKMYYKPETTVAFALVVLSMTPLVKDPSIS